MECATFGENVASHCKVHTGIQYFLGTGRSRSLRQWRHWRRLRLTVGAHQRVTQALQRTERWRTDGRCDGRNGLGAERRCGRRGRCGRLVTVGRWAHKQLTTAITHFAHVHKKTHKTQTRTLIHRRLHRCNQNKHSCTNRRTVWHVFAGVGGFCNRTHYYGSRKVWAANNIWMLLQFARASNCNMWAL